MCDTTVNVYEHKQTLTTEHSRKTSTKGRLANRIIPYLFSYWMGLNFGLKEHSNLKVAFNLISQNKIGPIPFHTLSQTLEG